MDDVSLDILEIKKKIEEEKECLNNIESKIDMVLHAFIDTSELKTAATKTDKRLDVLEEMISKVQKIKGKSAPTIRQVVYQTFLQTPFET